MNAYGRVSHIYNSMVSIGVNAHAKTSGGGKSAGITQEMKSLAQEHIPCGEQLKSAIGEETFPISEWVEYMFDTPDICLEKEMQWPDEPDLIY